MQVFCTGGRAWGCSPFLQSNTCPQRHQVPPPARLLFCVCSANFNIINKRGKLNPKVIYALWIHLSNWEKKCRDCSSRFRILDAYWALWRLHRRDALHFLAKITLAENLYPPAAFWTRSRQKTRQGEVGARKCLPPLQKQRVSSHTVK